MYALTIIGYEVFYSSELAEKSSKLAENRHAHNVPAILKRSEIALSLALTGFEC